MTLLVISPDYASHLYPLATLATAWRDAGERVVVATGEATASITRDFGFERAPLRLGRGSNGGVIRAEEQPAGEDESLRGFFDATRRGMVATLAYQAEQRGVDLLWDPVGRARAVQRLVDEVRPDRVIVDHLAFGARLGLVAAGVPHADVLLGHPSALPIAALGEVYGYPTAWPDAIVADADELAALRRECERVSAQFTERWNTALAELSPRAEPSRDAFGETGDVLLLNYPEALHPPERTAALPPHVFLGSAVRETPLDDETAEWMSGSGEPLVYVSFGSFLSARGDVLARVVEALRPLDARVALAAGSTPIGDLGDIPRDWLVREFLPQVPILERAALAITHGGNNSVTEAATAGVPMLVLPFSTDQFAGAAAVEAAGLGESLDPNAVSPGKLRASILRLLDAAGPAASAARDLGVRLRQRPGPVVARDAIATALSA